MPALSTKELQHLSDADLLELANDCVRRGRGTGPADAGLWLEAQLYLNERAARQMLRYTRWLAILTAVVTAATMWMAFKSCP